MVEFERHEQLDFEAYAFEDSSPDFMNKSDKINKDLFQKVDKDSFSQDL